MIDRRQALKLMLATPVLSHLALGQPPQADPFTDKMSSAMQGFVADSKLVCAAGFIFQRGRSLYEDAVGYSDLAAKTPIRTDAIFDVRSISKPVTAIGVMVLVDSGKISLNDPIDRYLPEFRNVEVNSSAGLLSPKMPPTIFNLLTDTAGINAQLNDSLTRSFALPLKEAVNLYATHPLEFEPGQKWEYSSAWICHTGKKSLKLFPSSHSRVLCMSASFPQSECKTAFSFHRETRYRGYRSCTSSKMEGCTEMHSMSLAKDSFMLRRSSASVQPDET
jgi:hypothetical protein